MKTIAQAFIATVIFFALLSLVHDEPPSHQQLAIEIPPLACPVASGC